MKREWCFIYDRDPYGPFLFRDVLLGIIVYLQEYYARLVEEAEAGFENRPDAWRSHLEQCRALKAAIDLIAESHDL